MIPFQGKILLEKGKIKSIDSNPGVIEIFIDNEKNVFNNAWAYPGFVDCHGHIAALGSKLNELDLSNCKSAEECVELALKKPGFRGNWLTGRGWNEELWLNKSFPDKKILDDYFPDAPVYFARVDGHAAWTNTKALQIAGIDKFTDDPYGGLIVRDNSGNPTGVLIDNAMELVKKFIPKYNDGQLKKLIISACHNLASNGLTQVHEADLHPENVKIFLELDNDNKLPVKIKSYLTAQNDEWKNYDFRPLNNKNFSICGLKFYADGALGSRGAALFEKYNDAETYGQLLIEKDGLYEKAKLGLENGFQIATHAIGDKANNLVLGTYSKLIGDDIADKNSLLRLEHAQIIRTEDLKYFRHKNIIASFQPIHCLSDAQMAEKRLGKNCKYGYPWNSILDNGGRIIAGSDFPIESPNPILGFDAFVRRVPFDKKESWYPDERISREEALEVYSVTPHKIFDGWNQFTEIQKGMIADLTILDTNLKTCSDDEIGKAKAIGTIVNGNMILKR